jgi:hypothetical protein
MNRNIMYGLTHDASGNPVVRTPRTCKVGIGRTAGPDIHTWISHTGEWKVAVGKYSGKKRTGEDVAKFASKDEARQFYREWREKAPLRSYPAKLQYFTFSRPGPDGQLEPDFDAIAAHGPVPSEIDIVFSDNQPLQASYEMWSAGGLQCQGDGIDAERILSLAQTDEEKKLAAVAKDARQRFFPVHGGCWTRDCGYSTGDRAPCKPHCRLFFHLINDIRLGARAQFDSTSFRTTSQLFSSIQDLLIFTGNGNPMAGFVAGIPLRMVVRPFKTHHDGKVGTAYGVSLEFRAEAAAGLRQKLLEYGAQFYADQTQRQITAPATVKDEDETPETDMEPEAEAAMMTSEFYPADDDDAGDPGGQAPADDIKAKTDKKAAGLRERLAKESTTKGGAAPETAAADPEQEAPPKPLDTQPSEAPEPPESAGGQTNSGGGGGSTTAPVNQEKLVEAGPEYF